MEVNIYNMAGEVIGQAPLSEAVFGVPMNRALVHQVAVAQLANARVGTASTKTRGQVAGGGKKPWRQKGTGRARQGTTRAPQWRGGGIVFGPHPRSYTQAIPRKMRRLALRCVLSSKVSEGRLILLDNLAFAQPRTREAAAMLARLNVDRSALLVTPEVDQNVMLSARNLPQAATLPAQQLNVVDLLNHDYLVLPISAVRQIEEALGGESAEPENESVTASATASNEQE